MTPRFLAFIPFVKEAETVYKRGHYGDDNFVVVERDPNDSGGVTKWGLDAETHGEGVAKLTWAQAMQIYFDYYWCGKTGKTQWQSCEDLPGTTGEIVFDTRINCGMRPAKNILIAGAGVPGRMLALRDARYKEIAREHPKDEEYLQGWLNRDANLKKYLKIT